ncbi:MAG: amidohydrolase family protein [Rhodothermales bacterium]|nr:amidohydrolase family protein [Rhodothermales bacterium]MBO6778407.1 amidohydrolase family protein [Rhodothermales bacterium]
MKRSLVATALLLSACAAPQPDLVIRNAQVLDVDTGELTSASVVVRDGVISEVSPSWSGIADTEVDAEGRVLIPGLVDAHTHVDHPDELNLYPAFGVTGVMVLRGFPNHLTWRSEIEEGTRFGPRMFLTGDYMDGYPPWMQPMLSVRDSASARAAVRRQLDAGFDMIKVYTRLPNELREAIVQETHAAGSCVIGHAGPDTGLDTLVAMGQDNIAHGNDINRWYFNDGDTDENVARTTQTIAAGSRTTVTPNLSWTGGLLAQGTSLDSLLARPVARALHPAILQPFRPANNRYIRNSEEWVPQVRARLEVENAVTLALQEAGVPLLAGTDASTAGVFPGDALHEELRMLVDAGLTPLQALQAATSNAGDFLRRCVNDDLRMGRIAEGYVADLVLLDDNPLEEITHSRSIAAVFTDGQLHTRGQLQARLDSLNAAYNPLRPAVIDLEQALFSGRTDRARVLFDSLRTVYPGEILFSQYTPFFVGFGYLYGENGFSTDPERLDAALDLYSMYAETYPDYHSAHYQLGLTHLARGDTAAARSSLEQAIAIHPDYPDALDRLQGLDD